LNAAKADMEAKCRRADECLEFGPPDNVVPPGLQPDAPPSEK
jgi:hypothetical protein